MLVFPFRTRIYNIEIDGSTKSLSKQLDRVESSFSNIFKILYLSE